MHSALARAPEYGTGIRCRDPVNWKAIKLIVDTATGSRMAKSLMYPRMVKAIKRHGIESLTPSWRYRYCCARLALGDFSSYWGWQFRNYKDDDPDSAWAAQLYYNNTWIPKWSGEFVDTLLVLSEQGLGDCVFFASIIPEAMIRCRDVRYETESRLHSLLERSLPGLVCDEERPFEERRRGDAYIPAADLLRMFRRDKSHFPGRAYLRPDPARIAEMERYRGRTGVSWRGRQGAIDPMKLGIDNPLSLQYGEQHPCIEVPDIDLHDDIEGVVALASVLKKLVTVPTTAHHLAGAVGTKTEIIIPDIAGEVESQIHWDHPCHGVESNRLPWYPNATVFAGIKQWKELAWQSKSNP